MFFRIEDPESELTAREYFEYATRMGAYNGVITARIMEERERQGETEVPSDQGENLAVLMLAGDYVQVKG